MRPAGWVYLNGSCFTLHFGKKKKKGNYLFFLTFHIFIGWHSLYASLMSRLSLSCRFQTQQRPAAQQFCLVPWTGYHLIL